MRLQHLVLVPWRHHVVLPVMQHLVLVTLVAPATLPHVVVAAVTTAVAKKNVVGGKSSRTKIVAHIATNVVTAVTREYP